MRPLASSPIVPGTQGGIKGSIERTWSPAHSNAHENQMRGAAPAPGSSLSRGALTWDNNGRPSPALGTGQGSIHAVIEPSEWLHHPMNGGVPPRHPTLHTSSTALPNPPRSSSRAEAPPFCPIVPSMMDSGGRKENRGGVEGPRA